MLKKVLLVMTTLAAALLCFLLFATTPASTGPAGILALFVLMYLTALGVLTFLFRGINILLHSSPLLRQKRASASELSLKRSYYYASVVALAPVMLVAMQSVGRIGVYQILLVSFFVFIGWIYVTNRTT